MEQLQRALNGLTGSIYREDYDRARSLKSDIGPSAQLARPEHEVEDLQRALRRITKPKLRDGYDRSELLKSDRGRKSYTKFIPDEPSAEPCTTAPCTLRYSSNCYVFARTKAYKQLMDGLNPEPVCLPSLGADCFFVRDVRGGYRMLWGRWVMLPSSSR